MKTISYLLFTVTCMLPCIAIRAQSNARPDDQLRLYGKVTDTEGKAIEGATVRVLVSRNTRDFDQATRGFVSTVSNQAGEVDLHWATNDPRYILCGGINANILVSAPGYEAAIESVSLRRFAVDAPMYFELTKAVSLSVKVRDAKGIPLANAIVRPAAIGDAKLRFAEVADLQQTTNVDGVAVFNTLPSSGLQQVFVAHPSIGNQCVSTIATANGLEATTLSTRSITGTVRVKLEEGYEAPKLETVKLRFTVFTDESRTDFTWAECVVANNGAFEIAHLSTGLVDLRGILPADMPYTFDYMGIAGKLTGSFETAELELIPATRVEGQILDEESEKGIQYILIDHFDLDGRPTLTDAEGHFFFWSDAHPHFYPREILDRYCASEAFFIYPQQLPVDGKLKVDPVRMKPMTTAKGKVIDEAGQPVVGAKISCSVKQERFTRNVDYWTDLQGNFALYHIANGDTVSLTAKTATQRTKSPTSLQISGDSSPELTVEKRPIAYFAGTVFDDNGKPVPNASVTVRKATIHEEESYGGMFRIAEPLFENAIVKTDAAGQFTTKLTTDFDQDVSISVKAAGYEAYNTGWREYQPSGFDGKQIALGKLQLLREPDSLNVNVKVLDAESSEQINGARVVFLGAKSGLVKSQLGGSVEKKSGENSDGDGSQIFVLEVKDGPQVIAATAEGYQPSIRCIDRFERMNDGNVKLVFKLGEEVSKRTPAKITEQQIREAAKALLATVSEPPANATFFKQARYLSSLAIVDPSGLVDRILAMKKSGGDMNILMGLGENLMQLPEEETARVLPILDGNVKIYVLASLAKRASNQTRREEFLSEMLIATKQVSGDDQLYAYSHLACQLLKYGMTDLAREILQEALDGHADIREIIDSGKRLERGDRKQGIARIFAPPLAIVDRNKALKLIELTAYVNEIDYLKSEAIAFMAGQNVPNWQTAIDGLTDKKLLPSGVMNYCEKVGFTKFEAARPLLQLLRPATNAQSPMGTKSDTIRFLLHLLENDSANNIEKRILVMALLNELQQPLTRDSMLHPSQIAASACSLVAESDPKSAEQLAFESLWLCEGNDTILAFSLQCDVAKELAAYDVEIAKKLVESCFGNWSWLFGEHDRDVYYQQVEPLVAAACIDPEWAVAKTQELCETELESQESRRLSVVACVIEQFGTMLKKLDEESR